MVVVRYPFFLIGSKMSGDGGTCIDYE